PHSVAGRADARLSTTTACPFFSFLLRRPRSSTLFPYTTLFRSVYVADVHAKTREIGRLERLTHDEWQSRPYEWAPDGKSVIHREDRKSTRLNSSHVAISYAVFCLKKNK